MQALRAQSKQATKQQSKEQQYDLLQDEFIKSEQSREELE